MTWPTEKYQTTVHAELTEKQGEALTAAAKVGWYEGPPRPGSMADIADLLGITVGPASRRVRAAEIIVMSDFIGKVDLPYPPAEVSDDKLRRIAAGVGEVTDEQEGDGSGRVVAGVSPNDPEVRELRRQLESDLDGGPR